MTLCCKELQVQRRVWGGAVLICRHRADGSQSFTARGPAVHWSVPAATLDSVTPHFAVPLSLSLASSSSSASQKHLHQTSWWLSVPTPRLGRWTATCVARPWPKQIHRVPSGVTWAWHDRISNHRPAVVAHQNAGDYRLGAAAHSSPGSCRHLARKHECSNLASLPA